MPCASNVTEAGFRIDGGFPARLTDALHARFERLPDGPPLFVIPTELVPDNGPRLAAMVDELAMRTDRADAFRRWLSTHVRFCASLVDRITTGTPPAREREAFEAQLGYSDALLTVTEPYRFWAIEGDPAALRTAFPIDQDSDAVVFAPDIGFYEERKLRLLNAPHTALAPVALLGGIRTVREAVTQPRLGAFLRRILFDEIIPATDLPADAAAQFARSVVERFSNPWLDHEWRMIATNQEIKMRIRVVPLIGAFMSRRGRAPEGLALACAAHLVFLRKSLETLAEASRLPDFGAAVERWKTVIEREGVGGALGHD
jgi:tagaturonate reductase